MPTFIEKRLQSLHDIDELIVKLTGAMSRVFETFSTKQSATSNSQARTQIADETKEIYQLLSDIAILLRKEVRIVDENTGAHDKNEDGIMILPIPVDQKNSNLGEKKLRHEIEQLSRLIETEQVANALTLNGKSGKMDVSTQENAAGTASETSLKETNTVGDKDKTITTTSTTTTTTETFPDGTSQDIPQQSIPTRSEEVAVFDEPSTQSTEPTQRMNEELKPDQDHADLPVDDMKDTFDDDGLF